MSTILLDSVIILQRTTFFYSDFDDAPALDGQPKGLAATEVLSQTPAAANLLAGTSSNPLDDLVSIFGSGGGLAPTSAVPFGPGSAIPGRGGFGFGQPMSPAPATPAVKSQPQQQHQPQDDLLGLF